jgi:Transposase DDE domain group 1
MTGGSESDRLREKVPSSWENQGCRCLGSAKPEGTFELKITGRKTKIVVSSDGSGVVCQAGGLPLVETLRVSGLDKALSEALEQWRRPRAVHDPGKIVCDLAVALTLGGDCLADVAPPDRHHRNPDWPAERSTGQHLVQPTPSRRHVRGWEGIGHIPGPPSVPTQCTEVLVRYTMDSVSSETHTIRGGEVTWQTRRPRTGFPPEQADA